MIKIPAGMLVKFSGGGGVGDIANYDYILAEDLSITLHSEFTRLVDGGAPKFFKMLAGVTRDTLGVSFSGEYKQLGLSIWDNTDPVSFSFSVDLVMRTNAKTDVLDPLRALIKLPLPIDSRNIQGLIPPGPSVLSALNKGDEKSDAFQNLVIKIGGLTFINVILTSAEPVVCRYVDDNQYPIYAKVQCSAQTAFIATQGMINSIFPE